MTLEWNDPYWPDRKAVSYTHLDVYKRQEHSQLGYRRERWPTPDGDFIDLDWLDTPLAATLLVLFHGLEGSSRSHYALAFAAFARAKGFNFVVPHFRGCSGELNHAPRAYHSGDYEEVGLSLIHI